MQKTYEVKVKLRFKGNPSDRTILRFVTNAIMNHATACVETDAAAALVGEPKVNTISVTKHLGDES